MFANVNVSMGLIQAVEGVKLPWFARGGNPGEEFLPKSLPNLPAELPAQFPVGRPLSQLLISSQA